MDAIRMTKDEAVKIVDREDIKEMLEADGWTVEGQEAKAETPRRGRPRREETESE